MYLLNKKNNRGFGFYTNPNSMVSFTLPHKSSKAAGLPPTFTAGPTGPTTVNNTMMNSPRISVKNTRNELGRHVKSATEIPRLIPYNPQAPKTRKETRFQPESLKKRNKSLS